MRIHIHIYCLQVYIRAFMKCMQQYTQVFLYVHNKLTLSKHQGYYYYYYYYCIFVLLKVYQFYLFTYLFIYFCWVLLLERHLCWQQYPCFFHAYYNLRKKNYVNKSKKTRNIYFQQQFLVVARQLGYLLNNQGKDCIKKRYLAKLILPRW